MFSAFCRLIFAGALCWVAMCKLSASRSIRMFSGLAGWTTVLTVELRVSLILCMQYEIATPTATLEKLMRTSRIDGSRIGNRRWNSSVQQPMAHPAANANRLFLLTLRNANHSTAPRLVNIVTQPTFQPRTGYRPKCFPVLTEPRAKHREGPGAPSPAASAHDIPVTPNTGNTQRARWHSP